MNIYAHTVIVKYSETALRGMIHAFYHRLLLHVEEINLISQSSVTMQRACLHMRLGLKDLAIANEPGLQP